MSALSLDFYGANRHTPYPFNAPYQEVTSRFIDAMVTLPGEYAGSELVVTYAAIAGSSGRSIELSVDGQVLFSRSLGVVVQVFGVYEIWTISSAAVRGTFVVDPEGPDVVYDNAQGLPLVNAAISAGIPNQVTSIVIDPGDGSPSTEVAGPGEIFRLQLGSNTRATLNGSNITFSGEYLPEGPCAPPASRKSAAEWIASINGQGPDDEGNINIGSTGVFLADPSVIGTNVGIKLTNVGKACCDCPDYVELFEKIRVTHDRLADIRLWALSNRTIYVKFLNYTKFLLRTCIVGETPTDGTNIAEC